MQRFNEYDHDVVEYRCRTCGEPISQEDIDGGGAGPCYLSPDPGESPEFDGYWCENCCTKIFSPTDYEAEERELMQLSKEQTK